MYRLILSALCLGCICNAEHLKAVAVVENKANNISGTVTFEETPHGIMITGNIVGLSTGTHGFHVHEKGDISDPKCLSTGGHFNPYNKTHGHPEKDERHVGDLGNIASAVGSPTSFSILDNVISLSGNNSILGRAIVIHAGEDDYGTGGFPDSNTTGHAGARLACGIIEKNAAAQHQTPMFLIFVFWSNL